MLCCFFHRGIPSSMDSRGIGAGWRQLRLTSRELVDERQGLRIGSRHVGDRWCEREECPRGSGRRDGCWGTIHAGAQIWGKSVGWISKRRLDVVLAPYRQSIEVAGRKSNSCLPSLYPSLLEIECDSRNRCDTPSTVKLVTDAP
jgi:hypothetical protein